MHRYFGRQAQLAKHPAQAHLHLSQNERSLTRNDAPLTVRSSPAFDLFSWTTVDILLAILEDCKTRICEFELIIHNENVLGFDISVPPVHS